MAVQEQDAAGTGGEGQSATHGGVTRRTFLDFLVAGSVAVTGLAVLGVAGMYLWPGPALPAGEMGKVEVGSEQDLPVGKGKVVPYLGRQAIVIHTRSGYAAFSAACTHAFCLVKWDEPRQQIVCPCHGAIFDTQGNVLSGPATRPLPTYSAEIINGKIYLRGV